MPLVADPEELRRQHELIEVTADAIFAEAGRRAGYEAGAMIELPQAALLAGAIARYADFFSVGTNDLTRTAFALGRDSAERFLPDYIARLHPCR